MKLLGRLSNKGQHGSSETPRQEFKSMQRVNYDNGWEPEHWSIATSIHIYGTTEALPVNRIVLQECHPVRTQPSQDNPAKNKIIINEIGNFSDDELDWIELRNVTNSASIS